MTNISHYKWNTTPSRAKTHDGVFRSQARLYLVYTERNTEIIAYSDCNSSENQEQLVGSK